MAHITSCLHLEAAKDGEVDFDDAYDYAENAVDRLAQAGVPGLRRTTHARSG